MQPFKCMYCRRYFCIPIGSSSFRNVTFCLRCAAQKLHELARYIDVAETCRAITTCAYSLSAKATTHINVT